MSNKKKLDYVSQKKVRGIKCDYLFLLGERSNGKSYCAKSICVQQAIDKNEMFIYLRRYDLDTKDSLCVSYFADLPIQNMTNGEYTVIDVFRKSIWLGNLNKETGKVMRQKKIGFCHALSASEHYKSLQFPEVQNILYEEVLPKNGQYLAGKNEPDLLQHYVSTIFRNRKGKVYLVGNLLTRICPYYSAWHLERAARQELGSIEHYTFHNDNGEDTDLAIYMTDSLNYNSGMFFGKSADNITKGGYETEPQPHLPKSVREYNVIYDLVMQYDYTMFYLQLLQDKKEANNIVWYVTPKTSPIKKGSRVVSTEFQTDPMYSRFLVGLTAMEESIFSMIRLGKICFSDDLTGTEFYSVLQHFTSRR